jgi:hypothetical protein
MKHLGGKDELLSSMLKDYEHMITKRALPGDTTAATAEQIATKIKADSKVAGSIKTAVKFIQNTSAS